MLHTQVGSLFMLIIALPHLVLDNQSLDHVTQSHTVHRERRWIHPNPSKRRIPWRQIPIFQSQVCPGRRGYAVDSHPTSIQDGRISFFSAVSLLRGWWTPWPSTHIAASSACKQVSAEPQIGRHRLKENRTGNTIFAGLGVSELPSNVPRHTWVKSLVAILSFCLGAFFFARYHRALGPLKRWVIMSSFLIQTLFMILTAALISGGVVSKAEQATTLDGNASFPWHELCPIALLAFQSAGQIVASRVLKYNSMPTVVLTSLFCDLMSDPDLFTAGLLQDPERNRRAAGAVMLFVGATISGPLMKSSVGYAGALWIATGVKGSMVLAWLLWSPKKSQRQ